MTSSRLSLYLLLAAGALLVTTEVATAFSIREFLGLDDGKKEQELAAEELKSSKSQVKNKAVDENVQNTLEFDEIKKIIAIIDKDKRKALLADEEAFREFIQREAGNKSVLAAARVNKVDRGEKSLFLVQRGTENIIREVYLGQLMAAKIPAGFPTDLQIASYYEKNKDKFMLPERMHVWQIFLPITEAMNKKEIELLKKQAETIIRDLKKGKIGFADAAKKYSGHHPSSFSGGYMGLIKISDLKPEAQKPLLALAEGRLSKPLLTDDGIHILKRGVTVPEQPIAQEEVRDQIRQLLTKQIRNEIRKKVYEQARLTYPIDLNDNKVEEWRLKIRTNLPAGTVIVQ